MMGREPFHLVWVLNRLSYQNFIRGYKIRPSLLKISTDIMDKFALSRNADTPAAGDVLNPYIFA